MYLVYISAKGHTKPCLYKGYSLNHDLPKVMEVVILRPGPAVHLNKSVRPHKYAVMEGKTCNVRLFIIDLLFFQ